jgi:hypothetical protein
LQGQGVLHAYCGVEFHLSSAFNTFHRWQLSSEHFFGPLVTSCRRFSVSRYAWGDNEQSRLYGTIQSPDGYAAWRCWKPCSDFVDTPIVWGCLPQDVATDRVRKGENGCLFDEIQNLVESTERRNMAGSGGRSEAGCRSAAVGLALLTQQCGARVSELPRVSVPLARHIAGSS